MGCKIKCCQHQTIRRTVKLLTLLLFSNPYFARNEVIKAHLKGKPSICRHFDINMWNTPLDIWRIFEEKIDSFSVQWMISWSINLCVRLISCGHYIKQFNIETISPRYLSVTLTYGEKIMNRYLTLPICIFCSDDMFTNYKKVDRSNLVLFKDMSDNHVPLLNYSSFL